MASMIQLPPDPEPLVRGKWRIAAWCLFWAVVAEMILALVVNCVPPVTRYWQKHVDSQVGQRRK
jgi:hypothetical protein